MLGVTGTYGISKKAPIQASAATHSLLTNIMKPSQASFCERIKARLTKNERNMGTDRQRGNCTFTERDIQDALIVNFIPYIDFYLPPN